MTYWTISTQTGTGSEGLPEVPQGGRRGRLPVRRAGDALPLRRLRACRGRPAGGGELIPVLRAGTGADRPGVASDAPGRPRPFPRGAGVFHGRGGTEQRSGA